MWKWALDLGLLELHLSPCCPSGWSPSDSTKDRPLTPEISLPTGKPGSGHTWDILSPLFQNGSAVQGAQLRLEFLGTPCERGRRQAGSSWPSTKCHLAPAQPWGGAEDWRWPKGWHGWWQMERNQKQGFVGGEAGLPKSPPHPTCSYQWRRKLFADSPSEDLVSTIPAAWPEITGSSYLPLTCCPPSSPSSLPWLCGALIPNPGRSLINLGLFNNPSISMKQAVSLSLFLTPTFHCSAKHLTAI